MMWIQWILTEPCANQLYTDKSEYLFVYVLGSLYEEFRRFFLGGGTQLRSIDLIYSSNERYRLQTEAMGSVYLELSVILRNFAKYGVETWN